MNNIKNDTREYYSETFTQLNLSDTEIDNKEFDDCNFKE